MLKCCVNCELKLLNAHFSEMMGIFMKYLQSRDCTHPHLPVDGIMLQSLQFSYHLQLAD